MPRISPLLVIVVMFLILIFVTGAVSPTDVFDLVLLQPMLNLLMLLSRILFGNFGLAIIALTIIIMTLMLPLTKRQMQSTRAMQEIRPKLEGLKKKYGKDKQRLQEETFKLYKESGVNPAGCGFTMLIQMPIWIALYQSVIQGLAIAPENLLGLSNQLYSWSVIEETVPLSSHFLWLDLGHGDPIMAILTFATMWVLQKMSTPQDGDPTQQSMQTMMQWMMPLMLGYFAFILPSGLAVYWVGANIIRIVLQYRTNGWGAFKVPSLDRLFPKRVGIPAGAEGTSGGGRESSGVAAASRQVGVEADSAALEEKKALGADITSQRKKARHGKHRDKRKVRGRGRRSGSS